MKKIAILLSLLVAARLFGAPGDVQLLIERSDGKYDAVKPAVQANSLLSFGAGKAPGTTLMSAFETAGTAAVVQAYAVQRGNHTGTQAIATVTGLQAALDGKQGVDADLTSWAGVTRAANFDAFVTAPGSGSLASLLGGSIVGTGGVLFGDQAVRTTDSPTFAGLTLTAGTTGTGNFVRAQSAVLVTPNLGTPSAVTLTNGTGLQLQTGISGFGVNTALLLAGNASGSGGPVGNVSPVLTTPNIGAAAGTSLVLTGNGALSAPNTTLTGTWVTGGTSTTTKPHLLIEPSGATSSAWSTGGTGIGVNAASGFLGRLVDLQVNGSSRFYVDTGGNVVANSVTAGSGSTITFNGRGGMRSSADGTFALRNNANTADGDLTVGSLTANSGGSFGNNITTAGSLIATQAVRADSYVTIQKTGSAPAVAANFVRLYVDGGGSGGKLRLMALFPTGAAQPVALEP